MNKELLKLTINSTNSVANPFQVTNGVACFQKFMNNLISSERLATIFVYVNNVTVWGEMKEEYAIRKI